MKNCGKVNEYDVIDVNLVIRHKTNKNLALKLLDTRTIWSMDKKAKERAMQEDTINPTKARAIVVSSVLKSAMFTFLRRFSKKEYPQRFFSDKQEAYNWLKSFL